MKTISVAELRQNPTRALDDAAAGQTYVVTKHHRPWAQLGPLEENGSLPLAPARDRGPVSYDDWPDRPTAPQSEIDELVDWARGDR